MAGWTDEDMQAALAIAAATSIREASRQTGIPLVTVHRHMRRASGGVEQGERVPPARVERERVPRARVERAPPQNMRAIGEEVRAQAVTIAVARVAEALTDRLVRLAERMYQLGEKAAGKVDRAISDPWDLAAGELGQPEGHDKDGAAWVRALVGVMSLSIDKAQLLAGKPTGRQALEGQVNTQHEYTINHILEDPASRDLARQLFRRSTSISVDAGREAESLLLPGVREPGPVDTGATS